LTDNVKAVSHKKSLEDMDFSGKRVVVRVDFNVPISKDGQVEDDTRITSVCPTIEYLRDHDAAMILISHLGRPKGERNLKYSLKPVAEYLKTHWDYPVYFAPDCIGEETEKLAFALKAREILLLENVRFYSEEEQNDFNFAAKLAKLGDLYVNDAFGTAHRAHASTEGIAHILPSCSGRLLEKEIISLCQAIDEPMHPFIAIIGGSKISDKIGVIKNLLNIVDKLLIGGGMANTFLAAKGFNMQKSLVETDKLDWAREILSLDKSGKIVLPLDVRAAEALRAGSPAVTASPGEVPPGWTVLDIGEKTAAVFRKEILSAATIVWNGPLGAFETAGFDCGTMETAKAMAETTGFTIIGGGDSAAAVHKIGLADKINHISTGGGASLNVLEGKLLPGVAALNNKC
jgi:phosphoglycerate kinase